MVRKPYRPGVHGHKRQRPISEYGRQVKEKQKFKVSYGLNERALRRIFEEAHKKKGSTDVKLIELLERRLDNVVFRLGLAASRAASHQLIIHGHVLINQKRVRSPGFFVNVGDKISIREASKSKAMLKDLSEKLKKYEAPEWLRLDKAKLEGEMTALPQNVSSPFDVSLLVDAFSR